MKRRVCGEKLIVWGGKTTRPKNWKSFLLNDENKEQLIQVMLDTWSSDTFSPILHGHDMTLICQGKAYHLCSDGKSTAREEIASLESTREETDARVILYCLYAKESGFKYVCVRSPESDIFFILLHHVNQTKGLEVLFETGKRNKRRCINVTRAALSLSPLICNAYLGLHAFTGCDSTSAFKGKGKVKAIHLVKKHQHFQELFKKLGESWTVSRNMQKGMEEFTCALHGKARNKEVNDLRYSLLQAAIFSSASQAWWVKYKSFHS